MSDSGCVRAGVILRARRGMRRAHPESRFGAAVVLTIADTDAVYQRADARGAGGRVAGDRERRGASGDEPGALRPARAAVVR